MIQLEAVNTLYELFTTELAENNIKNNILKKGSPAEFHLCGLYALCAKKNSQ